MTPAGIMFNDNAQQRRDLPSTFDQLRHPRNAGNPLSPTVNDHPENKDMSVSQEYYDADIESDDGSESFYTCESARSPEGDETMPYSSQRSELSATNDGKDLRAGFNVVKGAIKRLRSQVSLAHLPPNGAEQDAPEKPRSKKRLRTSSPRVDISEKFMPWAKRNYVAPVQLEPPWRIRDNIAKLSSTVSRPLAWPARLRRTQRGSDRRLPQAETPTAWPNDTHISGKPTAMPETHPQDAPYTFPFTYRHPAGNPYTQQAMEGEEERPTFADWKMRNPSYQPLQPERPVLLSQRFDLIQRSFDPRYDEFGEALATPSVGIEPPSFQPLMQLQDRLFESARIRESARMPESARIPRSARMPESAEIDEAAEDELISAEDDVQDWRAFTSVFPAKS